MYSLHDLLDLENWVSFVLGNSGSLSVNATTTTTTKYIYFSGTGKTHGFLHGILPQLCSGRPVYVACSDPGDFDNCTRPVRILPPGFVLNQASVEQLPAGSLVFYGKQ